MFFTRLQTDRSTTDRCYVLLLFGVLCIGIVLQILGAPLAFWDLDGSNDLAASAQLEGFSLMSGAPVVAPLVHCVFSFDTADPTYQFSAAHLFFHPPLAMG